MIDVLVVGPKKDYEKIVDVLYQLGTIHLQDVSDNFESDDLTFKKMDLIKSEDILQLLVKINGIYQIIPKISENNASHDQIYEKFRWLTTEEIIKRAQIIIGELENKTRDLANKKSDHKLNITALDRYEQIMEKIFSLERQIPTLEGFEVTVLLIQKEYSEILDQIRPEMKKITKNQFEFISADIDENTIAAITVFNKKYSAQVHSLIFTKNVNEVRIPEKYSNLPFNDAIIQINSEKKRINEEIAAIDEELKQISSSWWQELSVLRRIIHDREEEINAFTKFGQSDHTIMIQGWIPKKYIKKTKKELFSIFQNRVVLTEMPVSNEKTENAPVFYDNPGWVKPFEFFMKLVSPPKYLEVDPSPIIAIFFPIFFGIIVGDIGYGLCILGFALVMKWKFKELEWLQQLMNIMIISAIPTIFFGYLYGEFFGDFGEMMGWLHPVHFLGITWNRLEAMIPMLILAITLGVFHIFVGLGIGVFNAYTRRSKKHLCEKCGMIGVLIGIILLIGIIAGFAPGIVLIPAIIIVAVTIPLIFIGGGTLGVIEIMSTLGNILSYARIMAIGMASVILAMVANRLGGAMEVVALGIVIAVLLHMLNIILAMFSPSLHTVRLHIVEFYSKFYEGGGELYHPFGKEKDLQKTVTNKNISDQ
jgi:V/A-type H+-transporting ATPase subunit I